MQAQPRARFTRLLRSLALAATAAAVIAARPGPAHAGPHADVELDPTAYVLGGNSLHVGVADGHLRVDLGNFGLALPELVHGQPGFDARFDGYGAKLQWFLRAAQRGAFVGVDVAVVRVLIERRGTDLAGSDWQVGTGVHAGYRFSLPAGFYATAWVGVGYQWSAADVTLGGDTYEAQPVSVFPAIHLGYRFR